MCVCVCVCVCARVCVRRCVSTLAQYVSCEVWVGWPYTILCLKTEAVGREQETIVIRAMYPRTAPSTYLVWTVMIENSACQITTSKLN